MRFAPVERFIIRFRPLPPTRISSSSSPLSSMQSAGAEGEKEMSACRSGCMEEEEDEPDEKDGAEEDEAKGEEQEDREEAEEEDDEVCDADTLSNQLGGEEREDGGVD